MEEPFEMSKCIIMGFCLFILGSTYVFGLYAAMKAAIDPFKLAPFYVFYTCN
jgi:hypothetical protein